MPEAEKVRALRVQIEALAARYENTSRDSWSRPDVVAHNLRTILAESTGAAPVADGDKTPSRFDAFDGYYSVRFSGIEFARFAPSPVWSEYASAMSDVTDFDYVFVCTPPGSERGGDA